MSSANDINFQGRPEFELLVRLLSPRGADDQVRGLLARGPNWDRLAALAAHHRVLPHVYAALGGRFRDLVPAGALRRLEGEAAATARRNLMLTGRLLRLLALLAEAGVEAVPF